MFFYFLELSRSAWLPMNCHDVTSHPNQLIMKKKIAREKKGVGLLASGIFAGAAVVVVVVVVVVFVVVIVVVVVVIVVVVVVAGKRAMQK